MPKKLLRNLKAYGGFPERVNEWRLHTPFGELGRVTGGVGCVAAVRVG